jgi:hypothetical protein
MSYQFLAIIFLKIQPKVVNTLIALPCTFIKIYNGSVSMPKCFYPSQTDRYRDSN